MIDIFESLYSTVYVAKTLILLASDHFFRVAFSTVSVFGDAMVLDSVSLKLSR